MAPTTHLNSSPQYATTHHNLATAQPHLATTHPHLTTSYNNSFLIYDNSDPFNSISVYISILLIANDVQFVVSRVSSSTARSWCLKTPDWHTRHMQFLNALTVHVVARYDQCIVLAGSHDRMSGDLGNRERNVDCWQRWLASRIDP